MENVIEKLKVAYDREQENAKPPKKAGDFPLSYGAITDEWLTDVICRGIPGARVSSHRLGPEDEGNTSRRLIHLEYNQAGKRAGLPPAVFCKATHQFESRVSVGISGGVHSEVVFYRDLRPLLDIEAPQAVWADYDPETINSMIMLNPLDEKTEFCTLDTQMTDERLYGQMNLLAKLHGRFYENQDAEEALKDLPTWPEFFEKTKLFNIEKLCAAGFQAAKEVIPPRVFERAEEIWPATLASVEMHNDLPTVLTHGDVHLRNWYISVEGNMGLTDWQCASKGHWGRDLCYAITTATNVEKRREMEKSLIEYYLKRLGECGGPAVEFDEAWKYYRQQLFGALAWWTVTMPSEELPAMQPVESTLELIRRITHAIEDTDALSSFQLAA